MMIRREFITLLAGAGAWPLGARAQQGPVTPVIGYLSGGSHEASLQVIAVFKQGLAETGLDPPCVPMEYRFAEGRYDRLPALAAELVRRQVAVIVATTTPPALAAKAVTSNIPIVFGATDDPVRTGLVRSLNRPSGTATGIFFFLSDLGPNLPVEQPTIFELVTILRPPRRSASKFRRRCSPVPTR
jgi:ABC-type uncharacterized transport system substrate-binding protein